MRLEPARAGRQPTVSVPPPRRARSRHRGPLRLLSLTASYLPLLLMALLALGTWWLVKSTPPGSLPGPVLPPRHEPDYEMTQFTAQRFAADGALRTQIEGDRLRHYPDTDTLEIDNPRIRYIAPDGRIMRASAQRALANADASDVQLSGNAQVTREATASEAAIEFRGESLEVFKNVERLRSQQPVTVTQGTTELHAAGMAYDNLSRVVTLQGKVRAVFVPPARRAR